MYAIEGSSLTRLLPIEIDYFPEAASLYKLFPDRVSVVIKGSTLYHSSKSLRDLLNRNKFDYKLSNASGAFYFTDLPAVYTNCQIEVGQNLVMINYGELSEDEKRVVKSSGNENFWTGATNLGFDGRVFRNPDNFARVEDGNFASEIVIFRTSLGKLGRITAFPVGSERILYKYLGLVSR